MKTTNWTIALPAFIDANAQLPAALAKERAYTVKRLNLYAAVNNIPYGIMMAEIANQIQKQTGQTPAELLAQGITRAQVGVTPVWPDNNNDGIPDYLQDFNGDGVPDWQDTGGNTGGSTGGSTGDDTGSKKTTVLDYLNGIGKILDQIGSIFVRKDNTGGSGGNSDPDPDPVKEMVIGLLPIAGLALIVYFFTKD
ncbi:MAG: hypothetical protein LBS01_04990 [Prevotellaceae bacterium]|jgi:hypothetical protein|nr:hypothetical protein [Prevotellaceae bacterium]